MNNNINITYYIDLNYTYLNKLKLFIRLKDSSVLEYMSIFQNE